MILQKLSWIRNVKKVLLKSCKRVFTKVPLYRTTLCFEDSSLVATLVVPEK